MFASGYTPGDVARVVGNTWAPAKEAKKKTKDGSYTSVPSKEKVNSSDGNEKRQLKKNLVKIEAAALADLFTITPLHMVQQRPVTKGKAVDGITPSKKKKKRENAVKEGVSHNVEVAFDEKSGLSGPSKKNKRRNLDEIEYAVSDSLSDNDKMACDESISLGGSPKKNKKIKGEGSAPSVSQPGPVYLVDSKMASEEAKKFTRPKKRNKEKDTRTVFVGNVPVLAGKNLVKRFFKQYGTVESIRFRSAAPSNPKMPRKGVLCTKTFHKDRQSYNAYIVFAEKESAHAALVASGTVLEGLTINVDIASKAKKHNHDLSVFVGNLPFDVQEEAVREHFAVCGHVVNVRLVRDRNVGMGKGFGYVLFKHRDAVEFAIKLHGQPLGGRELRITRSSPNPAPRSTAIRPCHKGVGSEAVPRAKLPLPSNAASKDFQGLRAQQRQKLKKREKVLKKSGKGKSGGVDAAGSEAWSREEKVAKSGGHRSSDGEQRKDRKRSKPGSESWSSVKQNKVGKRSNSVDCVSSTTKWNKKMKMHKTRGDDSVSSGKRNKEGKKPIPGNDGSSGEKRNNTGRKCKPPSGGSSGGKRNKEGKKPKGGASNRSWKRS